jgi:hypothetical protein
MVALIYSALISAAEAAIGVNVIKGRPNWSRPNQTPPIAALEIDSIAGAGNRIGQKHARHALTLKLTVFAPSHFALAQMIDSVAALQASAASIEVAGQRVDVSFADGLRHQSETGVSQEDHGFFWVIAASYSLS